MVGIDARDDRDLRAELEERAVGLVGFNDEQVTVAPRRIRPDLVDLPCVPETATVRRVAAIAERIAARDTTGIPAALAATTSTFEGGIAVEIATSDAPETFDRSCPSAISAPRASSRSVTEERLRSLPETRWPMRNKTAAIALIPAPPAPTMWMCDGVARSITPVPPVS